MDMGESEEKQTIETGAVNERPEDLRAMRGNVETAEDDEQPEEDSEE